MVLLEKPVDGCIMRTFTWYNPRLQITISLETAEYLSVLVGQTNWGNKIRRRRACADLADALGNNRLVNSFECFDDTKR
jgi:hypothetical protein